MPLAPRREFPEAGAEGCAFFFTDAAREDGSGFGGSAVYKEPGGAVPRFLYMAERWSDEVLRLLQNDVLSMPAGECFGAVMLADAVARRLMGLSHLLRFTDSVGHGRQ